MADTGTPPVIPDEFKQYNSYVEDPKWQLKFSAIWPSVLVFFVLLTVPSTIRTIRRRSQMSSGWKGWWRLGVQEDLDGYAYQQVHEGAISEKGWRGKEVTTRGRASQMERRSGAIRRVEAFLSALGSVVYWSPPGLGLNAGQLVLITGYFVTVLLCMILQAPLISNSNRPGFIALAQLPPLFLFASKNSPLLLLSPFSPSPSSSLFASPSAAAFAYTKLNYLHRWSARTLFLGATLHGSLWIRNHLEYGLPILGEQKETSGVAALGVLGVLILASTRPVRRWGYQVFLGIHTLAFPAFFITICYHTIYAAPWIFPPLAFFGFDLLLRAMKYRVKNALLVPVDNQMTLIHIPHCTSGWTPGQHVRLRVFFSGRIFESHPLTILSATPDVSCLAVPSPATTSPIPALTNERGGGIILGARVMGDWTRALNAYATSTASLLSSPSGSADECEKLRTAEVPALVMLDGPYGGCTLDLGAYESVLLFAGGSGATFTLSLLDDIVGRCVRKGREGGEKTRRVEFAWCVRSFGSIDWFSPFLMDIATVAATSAGSSMPLDLHISIYVTCLCKPEAIPPIPNCDVTIVRPSVYEVLKDLVTPPASLTAPPAPRTPQASVTEKPRTPAVPEIQYVPSSSPAPSSEDDEEDEDLKQQHQPAGDIENPTLGLSASGKLPWVGFGGGLAVCASGPESLTREAANAVARLQLGGQGLKIGGVGLHTEVYSV
ncbi:hypothetical protein BDQ12DRAFT_685512 [Crucibulum laeve]|uniref:FAD-binding FR-type domain-containing protein n=1 Tax=Crucibulum laeve TaxID=68775 RepID=A0A5C3M7R8_9AGAR|nr:hypothetical protein BDQ12DRAFT_685512 [Crucibulum laeve]